MSVIARNNETIEHLIEIMTTFYYKLVDIRDDYEDDVLDKLDASIKPQGEGLLKRMDAGLTSFRNLKKLLNDSSIDTDDLKSKLKKVKSQFDQIEMAFDQMYDENPLDIGSDFSEILENWVENYEHIIEEVFNRLEKLFD